MRRFSVAARAARYLFLGFALLLGASFSAQAAPFSVSAQAAPFSVSAQAALYEGTCTPGSKYCAYFSPTDMPIQAVGTALRSAKKTIRIAAYNMDVAQFTQILREKLNQGVRIEFLVDYKNSFTTNRVWNELSPHANLARLRVPVLRGRTPQMHNKIILIDDEIVYMGSANFTYSGLVANYENVIAIRDAGLIAKVNAELDELADQARMACEVFAAPVDACGQGTETWDKNFKQLAMTGKFEDSLFAAEAEARLVAAGAKPEEAAGICEKIKKRGFLNSGNQPNIKLKYFDACLIDTRYSALARKMLARETYVDGTPVSQGDAPPWKRIDASQTGPVRAYFSPEDNLEAVVVGELRKTLKTGHASFAYVSTNFITNPAIVDTLIEMRRAGVRMKLFFDAGRYDDPNFQQQVAKLDALGFTRGEYGNTGNLITVFKNELTGPYGCNHNKFAVVGTPEEGVKLLNGSANWSISAMQSNDENLLVIEDEALAAIYLREMLSQLFVYRYGQREQDPGYLVDISFLTQNVPSLRDLLDEGESSIALSLGNVPADPAHERVWAWVPELNGGQGEAVELFTHNVFDGRWLTSVTRPIASQMRFKFFKTPKNVNPNRDGMSQAVWEYEGVGNDRGSTLADKAVQVIRGKYTWGVR